MMIDRLSVGVLAVSLVCSAIWYTGYRILAGQSIFLVSMFLLIALPFLYAFYLGKTGRADSPLAIAARFLAAGILGGLLASLPQPFGADADLVTIIGYRFSRIVHWVIPFTLAGLAGVPLGSRYGNIRPIQSFPDVDADGHPSDMDDLVEESTPTNVATSGGASVFRSHASYWIVLIAVVAVGIRSVILFPALFVPKWVAPVWWFVGAEWVGLRSGVGTVVLYGILFASAYYVGKEGWWDAPEDVARLYFVTGVISTGIIRILTGPPLEANILGAFYAIGLASVQFALAGLAGVPLGRIHRTRESGVNETSGELTESQKPS